MLDHVRRNHARAVLACDFLVADTVRFRLLYVFVVLDVGTRRIGHWNATEHPTAEWTQQQLRMVAPGDQPHRFLIHDRDSVFSLALDEMLRSTGLNGVEDASAVTSSECALRTADWYDSSRMP